MTWGRVTALSHECYLNRDWMAVTSAKIRSAKLSWLRVERQPSWQLGGLFVIFWLCATRRVRAEIYSELKWRHFPNRRWTRQSLKGDRMRIDLRKTRQELCLPKLRYKAMKSPKSFFPLNKMRPSLLCGFMATWNGEFLMNDCTQSTTTTACVQTFSSSQIIAVSPRGAYLKFDVPLNIGIWKVPYAINMRIVREAVKVTFKSSFLSQNLPPKPRGQRHEVLKHFPPWRHLMKLHWSIAHSSVTSERDFHKLPNFSFGMLRLWCWWRMED